VSHVHAGQQEIAGRHSNVTFCCQDCSYGNTGIFRHLTKTVTKRTNMQCPHSYLSTTSIGKTGIEDKQTKAEYFAINWEWYVFTV
jgi:hypothetical protein